MSRTIARGICQHCDEAIHEDHLGRWLDARVEPEHCPRSGTGTHHPKPSSVHAHTLHGRESVCRYCGQPIIEAADLTWHDLGDVYPDICVAAAAGPSKQHLPKPKATLTMDGEPVRCRHCGDELHIGDDGKWYDTRADDSPSWCVPSGDNLHHPMWPPAAAEPDPVTSDPDDPDETERLLAMGLATAVGAATPRDLVDGWQPGPITLEAARKRLRAWSEVRG